jgi:UDP-N-acetylglucosamine acyltransferase
MAIHPTAIVEPKVELGQDVEIGPFCWVRNGAILRDGVQLGSHCVVGPGTTIGAHTRVYHHAVLGEDPQDKKYRGEETWLTIGSHNVFREFTTVSRGTAVGNATTVVGDHNLFMAYSHVAHDCVVGSNCVFANSVNLAGHVEIQDSVVLGGLVGVHQHSRIGRCAMVGGGGMAAQDVPPFTIAQGDRARLFGLNIVGLRRNGYSLDVITALKGAYRELFNQGLPLRIALEQVREVYAEVAEVAEVVRFIEGSSRGICRSAGADPVAEV